MTIVQLTAKSGADGKLRFEIPAEAGIEFEVAVIVSAKPTRERKPTPEELGWPPGYFEATYGSIQDEGFRRYPQAETPVREQFE